MIGFIGLGVMGEPMCRNLAANSGEQVLAYDIDPAPMERLREQGVASAGSVREVAERCDQVFLSLPGVEQVKEVCIGPGSLLLNMRAGTYVVDLSTTTVALARDLNSRFSARGVQFVDAPVARTREAAQKGTLAIMVGAPDAAYTRLRPLLGNIGRDITHCGPPGAGQATKLINNMVLFANVVALAEGLVLARRSGLSGTKVFEVLLTASADSFALRHHGMKALLPDEFPERAYSVDYALKDLSYALEFAKQADIDLPGARRVRAILQRAKDAGFGSKYFPVVAKTY